MTGSPSTDQTDPATLAAAEGQAALGRGDTERARGKFTEAGELLLREVAGEYKQSGKSLLRFLAATQFYKGGDYKRAHDLAKKIEARFLPEQCRNLLSDLVRDAASRATPDYTTRVRHTCLRLWQQGEYRQVVDLLKDHPYVFESAPLAFLRAVLSERLGYWRAAAVFFAKAFEGRSDDPMVLMHAAGYPLFLLARGKSVEAWEYLGHLLELTPNAVTYLVASVVGFTRAVIAAGDEKERLFREQKKLFATGWDLYLRLSGNAAEIEEMRLVVALSLEVTSLALMRLGDSTEAKRLADLAVAHDPAASGALTTRGMLSYPEQEQEAVADFTRAAGIPGSGYIPEYFLAHHALNAGLLSDAIRHCESALSRKPSRYIAAQLHGWIAVCRIGRGAEPAEVEERFRKALDIDPTHPEVVENYRRFREDVSAGPIFRSDVTAMLTDVRPVDPDFVAWGTEKLSGTDHHREVELLLAGAN